MNIKLIVLVLLLDLGLVLSVSYFHADAYPLTQENTATDEAPEAMRAATFDDPASEKVSSRKGGLRGEAAPGKEVWNQSLFVKDLLIGLMAICVINGLLVLFVRKTGAAAVVE
jgi:hypothetical protein